MPREKPTEPKATRCSQPSTETVALLLLKIRPEPGPPLRTGSKVNQATVRKNGKKDNIRNNAQTEILKQSTLFMNAYKSLGEEREKKEKVTSCMDTISFVGPTSQRSSPTVNNQEIQFDKSMGVRVFVCNSPSWKNCKRLLFFPRFPFCQPILAMFVFCIFLL